MLAEKDVVHGMMEMVMLGVLEDVLVKLDLYSNIQKKLLSNTSYSTQVYYWLKIYISLQSYLSFDYILSISCH